MSEPNEPPQDLDHLADGLNEQEAFDMKEFELTPADWNVLLVNIEQGKCTPFLGAGACVPTLPSGSELADIWASEYDYPMGDRDLSKVAQFVAVTHRDGLYPKYILKDWFQSAPSPNFQSRDEVHRLLAELPLPVYVTTNYDDFMLRALYSVGKEKARYDICRWHDDLRQSDDIKLPTAIFDENSQYVPTKDEPVVFHLHGHKDLPESLVLTEDDYIDFLIAISENEKLLPARIKRSFTDSSLLFVGYSLGDWDFRLLFRKLVTYMRKSKRPHLSVQVEPFKDNVSLKQKRKILEFLRRYYEEMNVRVYWGKCESFAQDLRKKWEDKHHNRPGPNPPNFFVNRSQI